MRPIQGQGGSWCCGGGGVSETTQGSEVEDEKVM